jgi:hypothetical protein
MPLSEKQKLFVAEYLVDLNAPHRLATEARIFDYSSETSSRKLHQEGSRMKRKRIDWLAARASYVNTAALTYADIAKRFGINPSALRMRAGRENWTAERQAATAKLLQNVTEKTIFDTAAELVRYNEQDLQAAKALRALVAKKIQHTQQQGHIEARDLRSLAGAVESAQRIARLALGASTENTDARISGAERLTPEERRNRINQLPAQLFSAETVQ